MAKDKDREEKEAAAAEPEPKPELRRGANLTRAGMEDAIRSGGSVIYHGKDGPVHITKLADIPDEAILVEGDAAAAEAALASLDAQQAALAGRRAALERVASRSATTTGNRESAAAVELRKPERK